ncbi:DNA polymerase [Streptomyces hebeiensis]
MTQFKSPIPNLWDREVQNIEIFNLMESRGVSINKELCLQEIAVGEGRMNQLYKELGNRNPNSNKDLKVLLLDEMKLPTVKLTKNGAPSFDKEAMSEYELILSNNPEYTDGPWGSVAKNILEYRGWSITLGLCYRKFVDLLSPDGKLRCNYWLHGTKTGRTSCHDPNLQQTPKDTVKVWNRNIKKAFEADNDDYALVQFDFSQGEMRLAAGYAKQENLIDTFTSGRDMWGDMIAELERPKTQCKTLTYAKMYGAQRKKLTQILGGDDPDQFITDWENYHDKIMAFSRAVRNKADSRGYVYLWTGRIRHTKADPKGSSIAFNSVLQGGLAEIVKSAMIRLKNKVDSKECRMLLMVHDSVIFEIKREYLDQYIPLIKEVMSDVKSEVDFGLPFDVEHEMWGKDAV